jgi:FkbM family methyltransferase
MTIKSLISHSLRFIDNPQIEMRRTWFKLRHAFIKPHDLLCQVNGFVLKVHSRSVLAEPLFVGSGFEEGEMRLLHRLAKPGFNVFDIGANIGLYSVMLGKLVGPQGKIWSFEPFAPIASYLKENVKLNELENVSIFETAISDNVGTADFHVFPEGSDVYNSLGASIRNVEKLNAVRKIEISTTTLDNFAAAQGIQQIDLIKLDVEGAEQRVISGAEQLISRSPNIKILMELYDPSAEQCGCSNKQLMQMLQEWGFNIYRIDPGGLLIPSTPNTFIGNNALFARSSIDKIFQ